MQYSSLQIDLHNLASLLMLNYFSVITLCSQFAKLASASNRPFRRDAAHSITVKFQSKSATGDNGNFNFTNNNAGQGDDIYVGSILVNGKPFEVQLDTGSSDLWLDTSGVDLSTFINSHVPGYISYDDGTVAEGPILIGNVTFGNFIVEKQAFISAPESNATSNGDRGLLGIGPPTLSNIWEQLANTTYTGNSFLDNVFSHSPTEPNFMTFSLSRSEIGVTDGGVFTIGEIPTLFSSISDTPSLEVIPLPGPNFWAINIDAVVIGGHRYSGHGLTPWSGSMSAMLDTGTSLATGPPYYVDAMYKSIHGAHFDQDSWSYVVPCHSRVDISIVIGNVNFPINPIDSTYVTKNAGGILQCYGAFSYSDPTETVDFILGDTFLRNVFALYDFGNWTNVGGPAPFVKLLSITNATQADTAFESLNNARLRQVEMTGSFAENSSFPSVNPSALTRDIYIILVLICLFQIA